MLSALLCLNEERRVQFLVYRVQSAVYREGCVYVCLDGCNVAPDPSKSPLRGETLTALPSPVRRGVGVRSFSTNNEQRFQPRRGKIFVTPWQPYMYSDARNTFSKEQGLGFASQRKKIAKSDSHVLSCLDTRKNQRRSRHKSPKINGIYTHVSQKSLQKIISPFDHL